MTRIRTWLKRAAVALAAVLLLVMFALCLAFWLPAARTFWVGRALDAANAQLPFRVQIEAVERLDPWGAELAGVRLLDAQGKEMLRAQRLALTLEPLALLGQRVHVESLSLQGLHGLIEPEKLVGPSKPEEPPSEPSNLTIAVDALALDDVDLRMDLQGKVVRLVVQKLRAAGEWAKAPLLALTEASLWAELDGQRVLTVSSSTGRFKLDEGGHVQLAGDVVGASMALEAVLPSLNRARGWPLESAHLTLRGLTREGLSRLGIAQGAELATRVDLTCDLEASGDTLELRAQVSAGAASLNVQGQADKERAWLRAALSDTRLSQVIASLPSVQVSGALELQVAHATLPMALSASWRNVRVDAAAVPDGQLTGELALPRLRLTSLTLLGHEQALHLSGAFDMQQQTGNVDLALRDFPLALLSRFGVDGLSGELEGSLHAELLPESKLHAEGKLEVDALALGEHALRRGVLSLTADGPLGSPHGSASLVLEDVLVSGQRIDRAALALRAGGARLHAELSAQGEGTAFSAEVRGSYGPSLLELEGAGSGRVLGRTLAFALQGVSYREQAVSVESLGIRLGPQSLSLRGHLSREQRVQAQLELAHIDLASWSDLTGRDDLHGLVDGKGTLEGKLAAPHAIVNLTVTQLQLADTPPLGLHAAFDADLGRGTLALTFDGSSQRSPVAIHASAHAQLPRHRAELARALAEARVDAELSLSLPLELLAVHAGPELSGLKGVLHGELSAHGTLDEPELEHTLELTLAEQAASPARDEGLTVRLQADRTQATLEASARDAQGALMEASASMQFPGGSLRAMLEAPEPFATLPGVRADVRVFERRLDGLQGVLDELSRAFSFHLPVRVGATLTVQAQGEELAGALHTDLAVDASALDGRCPKGAELSFGLDAALDHSELTVRAESRTQELGGLFVDVQGAVQAERLRAGELDALFPLTLRAEGKQVALSRVPGLCALSEGSLSFALAGSELGKSAPELDLELELARVRVGQGIPLSGALRGHGDGTQLSLEGQLGDGKGARATLSARAPVHYATPFAPELVRDQPLSARVQARRLPVATLLSFAPGFGRPEGDVSAELTLGGTLAAPEPRGHLELHEVAFSLAELAQPFAHVNGRLELEQRTLRIRRLEARDRDGKVGATGAFTLAPDGSGKGQLALSAERFPLRQQGSIVGELSLEARLSAELAASAELDLALVLEHGRLWLTGERGRKVQALERHPDVHFSDEPAPAVAPVATAATGLTLRSLRFRSERDLWLMHQDFSVQVGVNVELVQVAGEPRLTGEATLRRGDLKLLGKSFDIERGTVTFTGDMPPDPALDLKASFQPPSGQKLIVQVSGRTSAPELTFSGAASNAGEAVAVLSGVRTPGAESQAQTDAKNFAVGVTAGLLTMTARREFGDWVPMLSVETNDSGAVSQARAGFDASDLIPPFLEGVARGAYVEGVVGQRADSQTGSVGVGVRLEVALPRDFITTMGYGPGPTWSVDAAWAP